jgi:hypothetical protein
MTTFAFSTMAFPQGGTFVFGSWICVANGSGGFDSHLTNPIEPEAISTESCNAIAGSDDHGDMLFPDLAKEIEQKLNDKPSSTRTQIDFSPSPTRVETLFARPIFGLRNASSAYQRMIKSLYTSYEDSSDHTLHVENFSATTSWGTPVFDEYSDSDESSNDNLDPLIDALAKIQLKSCHDYSFAELLNNLREVASIDDIPFQHGTPLTPIQETGSGGTELADYE